MGESSVLILPTFTREFYPTEGILVSLFIKRSKLLFIKAGSCAGFCYADLGKLLAVFHQVPGFVVFTALMYERTPPLCTLDHLHLGKYLHF